MILEVDHHETTVDGGHPTDLGFLRMADALEPRFREILGMMTTAGRAQVQP